MNVGKVVGGVAAGGALGAAGVMGARAVVPPLIGALKKIPVFGPWFSTSPRAQQFASDMTVAIMAAPGVVLGHALLRKSPAAAAKEAAASVTK